MTAHEISNELRSRRALLGGMLGGVGAWAASAIGRVNLARAADGDPVLVGRDHTATGVTQIVNSDSTAISGISISGRGVRGHSSTDRGVQGLSDYNVGVQGGSGEGVGVMGSTSSGKDPAIVGIAGGNNTGVQGYSGVGLFRPPAKKRTGVYGVANQDATSKGVWGESDTGWAGYFDGRLFVSRYVDIAEGPTPAKPTANRARLFVRENASRHVQLCVRFPNGNVRVLGTA